WRPILSIIRANRRAAATPTITTLFLAVLRLRLRSLTLWWTICSSRQSTTLSMPLWTIYTSSRPLPTSPTLNRRGSTWFTPEAPSGSKPPSLILRLYLLIKYSDRPLKLSLVTNSTVVTIPRTSRPP
ncbi:hypothetical protein B0T16DRAFT_401498, partial [Cercophora newfieldiana]